MAADLSTATGDAAALAAEAYRIVVDDPERARALAATALGHARTDAGAASAAHRALGMAALELDDAPTAVRHLERAVRAGRRGGPQREAEARMSLALALVAGGATQRALAQAERAVHVEGAPDRGALHLQRAIILERLGRLDEALGEYRRALAGFRRRGDRNGEARVLCDRGVLQTYRGRLDAAEADLRLAGALCQELGLALMTASVEQNLGFVAAQRGDVPAALAAYERAQAQFATVGGTRYALLELDRGQLLLATGLVREARESADRALRTLERTGMDAEVAEVLLQRGDVALAERDWARAAEAGERALQAFTAQRRPTWAALARYTAVRAAWHAEGASERVLTAARRAAAELTACGWTAQAVHARLLAAQVALALGRTRFAARELEVARRARRHGPAAVRIAGWHAEALRCLAAGRPDGARRAVAGGLRALDEHRAALGATELRWHAAGQAGELARLGLGFALEGGRPGQVLAAAERARARALNLPPVRPPQDPALAQRLGELRAAVTLAAEEVRAGRPSAALVRRQTQLEHEIRRRLLAAPGTGHWQPVAVPTLRAVREALGPRALIAYSALDGRLHAVAVTAHRARLVTLGPVAEVEPELQAQRFALHRMAEASVDGRMAAVHRANARHAAERLQERLLAPLLGLVGDRELVIVPTGPLHALPWATLPACAGRPLSVAPSAALWLRARRRLEEPAGGRVALVAGPGLAHAEGEVRALAERYGDAVTLTGAAATVDAVAGALRDSDRAHLACHGSFRAENPLFSSLLLADGPLTVHDLETLGPVPREIVLSACDSGLAAVQAGDELMGLAAALLSGGAGVIVASAVAAPDAPTRPLMEQLHRQLCAGNAPAAALAAARAAVAGDGDAAAVARDAFLCFGAG